MTDRRLRAALLDIDGTLVDSNDAHAQAWVETLAEAGHHVPFERVRPRCEGLLFLHFALELGDPIAQHLAVSSRVLQSEVVRPGVPDRVGEAVADVIERGERHQSLATQSLATVMSGASGCFIPRMW